MEVASGEDFGLLWKDERIVRYRIGLDPELFCGKAELIQAGTQHLGLTSEGIGILNVTAVFMGCIDFTLVEQLPEIRGHILLTAQSTDQMNPLIEWVVTAEAGFDGQGSCNDGGSQTILCRK